MDVTFKRNLGLTGRSPALRGTQQSRKLTQDPPVGESIPYLSSVRFLPSTMTLLNIRLIRVW
jgi:hypothetical protein